MGINANVLEKLVNIATTYRNIGVKLFLFGGDLVNGYTSSKDDFSTMLYAFKQIVSPYWCSYPFYSVMATMNLC